MRLDRILVLIGERSGPNGGDQGAAGLVKNRYWRFRQNHRGPFQPTYAISSASFNCTNNMIKGYFIYQTFDIPATVTSNSTFAVLLLYLQEYVPA